METMTTKNASIAATRLVTVSDGSRVRAANGAFGIEPAAGAVVAQFLGSAHG